MNAEWFTFRSGHSSGGLKVVIVKSTSRVERAMIDSGCTLLENWLEVSATILSRSSPGDPDARP